MYASHSYSTVYNRNQLPAVLPSGILTVSGALSKLGATFVTVTVNSKSAVEVVWATSVALKMIT